MKRMTAMALAVVLLATGCGGEAARNATELLALGEQYLLELDYEQALAQFLKVAELEPGEPRGYTGAAEAYLGLGDADAALAVLERGLPLTDDDALREERERLLWDGSGLLEEMFILFEAGRYDEALEAFGGLGNDIQKFSKDSPTRYLTAQGRGVGIYYHDGYGIYYGGYDGELRSGEGFWCPVLAAGEGGFDFGYRLHGLWENDLPNGYAELSHVVSGIAATEIRYHGTLSDGLWDGELWYYYCGKETTNATQMFFENGYIQILDVVENAVTGEQERIVSYNAHVQDRDGNVLREVERIAWYQETELQYGIIGIAGTGNTF